MADKKKRWAKRRLHMRGLKAPRIFVMILGRLHSKKKKLSVQNGMLSSPYLEKKEKDFAAYCSKMYKLTAKLLQQNHIKEEKLSGKLTSLTAKLSALMDAFSAQKAETVQEKRKKEKLRKSIQECRSEAGSLIQELKETQILIAESELETEEMILTQQRKAEALIVVYLDGANYPLEGRGFELPKDKTASELYFQYTAKKMQPEQAGLKEVDTYVIQNI